MTTEPVANGVAPRRVTSFERFAGTCAVLAGVAGFLYAVAFVVLQNVLLSGLFLMLGGLLSTAVLATVYDRLRETDASFARRSEMVPEPFRSPGSGSKNRGEEDSHEAIREHS